MEPEFVTKMIILEKMKHNSQEQMGSDGHKLLTAIREKGNVGQSLPNNNPSHTPDKLTGRREGFEIPQPVSYIHKTKGKKK